MVLVSIISLVSWASFDGSDGGFCDFKTKTFNGYIVRKMGTFRYYPQPLKYKAIQGVKKLLGRKLSLGGLLWESSFIIVVFMEYSMYKSV